MKNKICKISLFSAILACVANMPVNAAIKVKNASRSYAGAYNQINALQQQQSYYNTMNPTVTTASATANLPVAVDDKQLADSILNNSSSTTNMSDLEACAMIYPEGLFKWGIPESGVRANQIPQCVAVVELRDANTKAVLATTTVAAGDIMKCNADMFPLSGLLPAIEKVEVPRDEAPTMADVEKALNEEQKQNAGFKIAAAAIISGIAGNMLAPKNVGDTKLMGTSKTQILDTAIGATAGAGIMAASTYSGKVAGDTIKSTAVNAAAGMVVGNMSAGLSGGDSVIYLSKCIINPSTRDEKDCVFGTLKTYDDTYTHSEEQKYSYLINKDGRILKCERCGTDHHWRDCEDSDKASDGAFKKCTPTTRLLNMELAGGVNYQKAAASTQDMRFDSVATRYSYSSEDHKYTNDNSANTKESTTYFLVTSGNTVSSSRHAYAVYDHSIPHKAFGYKITDFDSEPVFANPTIYSRGTDGSVGSCLQNCPGETTTTTNNKGYKFEPTSRDASDGALVDLSNEARAKGTLIGTAAGGALGGFAGYQGAKTELEQRWVDAIRVYNDSLSNFVCMTGNRYLAKYNDYVEIPELKKEQ